MRDLQDEGVTHASVVGQRWRNRGGGDESVLSLFLLLVDVQSEL